ncbi:sensor histidine kinase [Flavobacterium sp.]|jgi:two-component system LytT family sensor kinase|uniref:sensor histidine kinase n=1 Tax=Flavobacterium sp. TaxID=239 RepID=UPI0037BEEC29
MSKWINYILAILIWSFGFYFTVTQVKMIGVLHRTNHNYLFLVTVGLLDNMLIFYGISKFIIPNLFTHLNIRKSINILLIGYFVITILESIFDYIVIGSFKNEPLYLWELFFSNLIINFAFVVAGSLYGFSVGWFKNEKQKKELQKENLKAELAFLKAQVNPHFLFNVLNMAYSSASKSNDEKTAEIISELASLMRYMLYESNVLLIAIEKEIEYINNYVLLQKKRLSKEVLPNIVFNCHMNNEKLVSIAPMLLIPFVENAFKHGIRMGKETFIEIDISVDNKSLVFKVKNSIAKRENTTEKIGGIGLSNVKKRLELLYPNKYELSIKENAKFFDINLNIQFE